VRTDSEAATLQIKSLRWNNRKRTPKEKWPPLSSVLLEISASCQRRRAAAISPSASASVVPAQRLILQRRRFRVRSHLKLQSVAVRVPLPMLLVRPSVFLHGRCDGLRPLGIRLKGMELRLQRFLLAVQNGGALIEIGFICFNLARMVS